jgi:hypothetical protein
MEAHPCRKPRGKDALPSSLKGKRVQETWVCQVCHSPTGFIKSSVI